MAIPLFQINPIIIMIRIHDRRVGEFLLSLRGMLGLGVIQ